jgi:hypothetical protein
VRLGLATLGQVALVLALGCLPGRAAQADDVAGALTGAAVVADGDVGGVVLLDVWAPFDVLRIGGFVGVGAIVADRDERNRVMMPVGASIALVFGDDIRFTLLGRGGMWGGSTQDTKLTVGGFLSGGLGLGFSISPTVSVGGQLEIWGVLGAGETWAIVPGLSLAWGHPVASVTEEPEE